jgi:nicotinate-nucleotide--dimethylbenzimidazole phosphoribosyltransferase
MDVHIPPFDEHIFNEARMRMDALAKPPGSLGRIEVLGAWLAGCQGQSRPTAERPRVIVFAGDHGVAKAHQVTPYPAEVTPLMVRTFAAGRAAISVLAGQAGATVEVVDCGVNGLPLGNIPTATRVQVVRSPIGPGTRDLVAEPAMTAAQCSAAMRVGAEAADRAANQGCDVIALGEMGIGNTTAAAAVAARLLARPAADLAGPGTGLDMAGVSRKAVAIQRALDRGGPSDPAGALADLGGFEMAALVGCILQGAARSLPVVLDGFIVGASALVAVRLDPRVRPYLLAATRSGEPGHRAILAALGIDEPVLDLGLRLGEATGAALVLPMLRAAAHLLSDMATLDDVLNGRV